MEQKPQVRILHHLCEVLLVVPCSTGNPLMDLMSVPDNNAWSRVDYFIISYVQYSQVDMNP